MEKGYIYDKYVCFFVQDIVANLFSPKYFFFMALYICNNVGHIRFPYIKHVSRTPLHFCGK